MKHSYHFFVTLFAFIVGCLTPVFAQSPAPGLTHWWPGNGNANDAVGSIQGTLHGGASFGAGLVGQAFSFDGIDGYADFGNSAGNFGTSDFTVDLWVNSQTNAVQVIIEKCIETFDPTRTGWGVAMLTGGQLHFYGPLPDTVPSVITTPVNFLTNTWNYLALTRQSGTFVAYWNGFPVGTNSNPGLDLDSTSTLKLGHRGNPSDTPGSSDTRGFFLNGAVNEVRIWNRALSAEEVVDNYVQNLPLSITGTADKVSIRWPASSGSSALEFASDLSPPASWQPVTNSVATNGAFYSVTMQPSASCQFFRLRFGSP